MADALRGLARIGLALLAALVVTACVIRLAHGDPRAALTALLSGAFGTPYDRGSTLTKMIPLLLTGLGVALAFRVRFWNIGGEGQFLMGTLAACALGAYRLQNLPPTVLIPITLLGGALAGAAWAGLAGWMRLRRQVPEVISTIMLNFIASSVLSWALHGPLQQSVASGGLPGYAEPMPASATLPNLWAGTPLHAGLWIALAAAALTAVFLARTPGGFALRAVGANADAARIAGMPVERIQFTAMLWSGALCGLAGAVELSGGMIGTLYGEYSSGYGFQAIAVALLGRLNPLGIVASALFFGALSAGSGSMERTAGVSSYLVNVIQAAALLLLLAFGAIRWARRVRPGSPAPPAATDVNTA